MKENSLYPLLSSSTSYHAAKDVVLLCVMEFEISRSNGADESKERLVDVNIGSIRLLEGNFDP